MKKALLIILAILFFLSSTLPAFAYDPRYRFTDQENDAESGLYNFDAREYNPNTGRFNQPDPVLNNLDNPQRLNEMTGQDLEQILSDPQNLNPYSYTKNNPVNYVDPNGEFNFETNEVESGDTLYGVFGENWKDVSNYNNLKNPNLIYPGQHLNLPNFVKKSL
jgi:RHS repeat-associated protein